MPLSTAVTAIALDIESQRGKRKSERFLPLKSQKLEKSKIKIPLFTDLCKKMFEAISQSLSDQ